MNDNKYKKTYTDLKNENHKLAKNWNKLKANLRRLIMELEHENEQENISIDEYVTKFFTLKHIEDIINDIEREV